MSSLTTYQILIDEKEKQETFSVLHKLGITPAQAIRMFFTQIRATQSLPFSATYEPNVKTAKILSNKEYSKGFDSIEDLFAALEK